MRERDVIYTEREVDVEGGKTIRLALVRNFMQKENTVLHRLEKRDSRKREACTNHLDTARRSRRPSSGCRRCRTSATSRSTESRCRGDRAASCPRRPRARSRLGLNERNSTRDKFLVLYQESVKQNHNTCTRVSCVSRAEMNTVS